MNWFKLIIDLLTVEKVREHKVAVLIQYMKIVNFIVLFVNVCKVVSYIVASGNKIHKTNWKIFMNKRNMIR